jgi:hypothetical protein
MAVDKDERVMNGLRRKKPEAQHSVPHFVLKRFTQPNSEKIWVYDKQTDAIFESNITKIAAEKGFYDLNLKEGTLTVEPFLAGLESKVGKIVNKIIASCGLTTICRDDKIILAVFLAVQYVRTKEHRLKFNDLNEALIKTFTEMGAEQTEIEELRKDSDPNVIKLFGIDSVLDSHQYVPYLLNKTWVLFKAPTTCPLYISDNPITMHNGNQFGPYGNIGLAVRGIEIYFPISSNYSIGLLCESIGKEFREAYYNITYGKIYSIPGLLYSQKAEAFCKSVVFGSPVPLLKENVTALSSLQVEYSSRFVYSSTSDFSLVQKMIKDNPKYREALKPRLD